MSFGRFLKKAARFVLPVAGAVLGGPLGATIGGAVGNLISGSGDGGGGGGGGGGGNINFNDPSVRNQLLVSENERRKRIEQLRSNLGTLHAQSLNRSRDSAAFMGLPAATRLAQEARITGNVSDSLARGIADIDIGIADQNRAAQQFILGGRQRQALSEQERRMRRSDRLLNLAGNAALAAGQFFGGR